MREEGGRGLARAASIVALALALGAGGAEAGDPSPKRLGKAIDPIVSRPEFAPAFWGIEVRSLASGRTLYARNAEKAFRPASNMKLVTTAAALDAYGSDARLRTTVETAGRLDGLGRILGDVYLVGRGDPNLSARFSPGLPTAAFEEMADALVAAGVRRVEGRVIGHEGAFTGDRRGADWEWEDLAWGYGTEVSALSFADNLVEVTLKPGERVGDPAVLETEPRHGLPRRLVVGDDDGGAAAGIGRGGGGGRDRLASPGAGKKRRAARGPRPPRRGVGRPAGGLRPGAVRGEGVPRRPRGEGHPRDGRRRHLERPAALRRTRPRGAREPVDGARWSASSTRGARTSTPRCCCGSWA